MKKLTQKQFEEKQKGTSKYERYRSWVEDFSKELADAYDKYFLETFSPNLNKGIIGNEPVAITFANVDGIFRSAVKKLKESKPVRMQKVCAHNIHIYRKCKECDAVIKQLFG